MTEPAHPPVDHKQLARELDRRRFRRRLALIVGLGAAIALAVIYGTCGKGWGLGAGGGSGVGLGSAPAAAVAKRCTVRVDKAGVTIDGAKPTDPVAQCAKGADVTVTGDAPEGAWAQLRDQLAAAKIEVALHDATNR